MHQGPVVIKLSPYRLLAAAPIALARSVKTVVLDVSNMTCGLCPVTVRKALENVPGVERAKVDYAARATTVTLDADKVPPFVARGSHDERGLFLEAAPMIVVAKDIVLKSILTCPNCGFAREEMMPTDACSAGTMFAYKADCSGAACTGSPITAWSCSSTGTPAAGTSINPKYLPATCR